MPLTVPCLLRAAPLVLVVLLLAAQVEARANDLWWHDDKEDRDWLPLDPIQIQFAGNAAMADAELEGAIAESLNALRKSGSRADMVDAAYDLENYYRSKGYAKVVVQAKPETRSAVEEDRASGQRADPGGTTVSFVIREGPRITIRDISFRGVTGVFSNAALREFFESMRTGLFGLGDLVYVEGLTRQACDKIGELYRLFGYLDVAVTVPDLRQPGAWLSESDVRLIVAIDEGIQYVLMDLEIVGEMEPDVERVLNRRLMPILNPGDEIASRGRFGHPPYLPRMHATIRANALEELHNRGHHGALVEIEADIDRELGDVYVTVRVTAGHVFEVGAIDFVGADGIDHGFLRSIMHLKAEEGQIYSIASERESYRKIMRTNLVTQLRLDTAERTVTDADGTVHHLVDYVVRVTERDSVELSFGIGWGSYELLRGYVALAETNLFGIARTGEIRGGASFKSWFGELVFRDQWTLGGEFPFAVTGFFRQRVQPNFTSEEFGVDVSITHRFSKEWEVRLSYQFRKSVAFDIAPSFMLDERDRDADLGGLTLRTAFDARDSVIDPSEGIRAALTVSYQDTFLGSDVRFIKLIFEISAFIPLIGKDLVLGLNYEVGVNLTFEDRADPPIQERFVNGGQDTIRAFGQSRLLLADELGPDTVGGRGRNIVSIELRHIIVWDIYGALFVDIGNLARELEDMYDFDTWRIGIGYGIRYVSPIGPARFDVSWNVFPRNDVAEDDVVFHFSVGYPF